MTDTATGAAIGSPAEESASLRERKKTQTRRAIHEATLLLIEQHGMEGATIEQICAAADVSPRTFFNYFPSKPAAALDLPSQLLTAEAEERFLAAEGGLVPALCELVGSAPGAAQDRSRMKALIAQHPDLFPALSQWMTSVRGEFIRLAESRAADHAEAELAVTLVMSAMGVVIHRNDDSDAPLADRIREQIALLLATAEAPLRPVREVPAEV
jgi:AcrR family transcriptional regulator